MDKALSTAKGLGETVAGFLNHHIADLNAVAVALNGIVAALPTNAETRASINQAITRVQTSADNITTSLTNLGAFEQPTFHIRPADIDTALDSEEGRAILSQLMADYLAKHPQPGAVPSQADSGAATAAETGDAMQRGDRSGSQQLGEGDQRTTSEQPQTGTDRQEEAPAPSSATAADKRAAGGEGNGGAA